MPGLGSLSPSYRALTGLKQDVAHTHYKELKKELLEATEEAKNVIFASGHEHGMQYNKNKEHHFIISGVGSKTSFMARGNDTDFVASKLGYSKVYYYENKEVWLEFITVENNKAKIAFRKKIIDAPAGTEESKKKYPEISQDSFRMAANADYDKASGFKKIFFGKQYRELWGTEVTARVIDLETEKGGLTPIKKGGGTMSNSLRLETKDGRQYVLRSVDKYLEKALPEELRDIQIAAYVLGDQTSTMHPYSALPLPSMAEAAGIYYHKPELVYLSRQNGLGAYNDLFEEGFYLLEARADGDRSDLDNLGNSKNTVDKEFNPKQGIRLNVAAEQRFALKKEKNRSGILEVSTVGYITFGGKVQFTIAHRMGGAYSWGNAEFYQNPTLGNSNYLRGYRNERFNGESIFYNNMDLRIHLFSWKNKVLPMDIGLLGGFDITKVWSEKSPTDRFRRSYATGLWISPVSYFVLNPYVSFSGEGTMFTFRIGFNF